MNLKNNEINNNEIQIDYCNEISIGDLIYEIDNSKEISLFKINQENEYGGFEKNILIQIKKGNE